MTQAELTKKYNALCKKIIEHYTHDGLQLMRELMSLEQAEKELSPNKEEPLKPTISFKSEPGPLDDAAPGLEGKTGRGQAAPAPTKPIPSPLQALPEDDLPF